MHTCGTAVRYTHIQDGISRHRHDTRPLTRPPSIGIYGGDTFAMKSASLELLGLKWFFNLNIPGLHVPLMAVINFRGWRLICTSALPLGKVRAALTCMMTPHLSTCAHSTDTYTKGQHRSYTNALCVQSRNLIFGLRTRSDMAVTTVARRSGAARSTAPTRRTFRARRSS